MRILVDMDDVLEQLIAAWVDYLNDKYGTDTTIDQVTSWDMSLAFPTLTKEQVYCPEFDPAFWDRVKPIPGARVVLEKLISEGHEIYVVTATFHETLREKMDNVLFKYYPFLSWKQVIISFNKQMISGDVLIDDAPHNLTGGTYRKILFEANHNKSFDETSIGAVRARNWDEVYSEIQRISQEMS